MSDPDVYIRVMQAISALRSNFVLVTIGGTVHRIPLGREPEYVYVGSDTYSFMLRDCNGMIETDPTNRENYTFLGLKVRRVLNDRHHLKVV